MKSSNFKTVNSAKLLFLNLFLVITISAYSQNKSSITGMIVEGNNKQSIPFASIKLTQITNTSHPLLTGTISNNKGVFTLNQINNGKYKLQISSVGYKQVNKTLEITYPHLIDEGTIYLQDSAMMINEAVVIAERKKGKSETAKTIYNINKKTISSVGNASELLRHIPGIQVDLKQNISIDGDFDILLFVDDIERDKSYINQINPSQIDRIEVSNTPPPNYDGNISGVINIILKKESKKGISGHLFTEIPTSTDIVYLFPTYNINCSLNKMNIYTSYNGEINYEDIDEISKRHITNSSPVTDYLSNPYLRQKNISHKIHYGLDYHLSPHNIFNFYGFYNHYSYEQDGNIIVHTNGNENWNATKNESDNNNTLYHSIYYKHSFSNPNSELKIDVSHSNIHSANNVTYQEDQLTQINTKNPKETATSIKIDFSSPINEKVGLRTGTKAKLQDMHDKSTDDFNYNEKIYALYGTLDYKAEKINVNTGLRVEEAKTEVNKNIQNTLFSFLPYVACQYIVNKQNNIILTFRRQIHRPSVYSLNPYSYTDDPYTIEEGNSLLKPELRNILELKYSGNIKNNFITVRLFYESITDAIQNMSYINNSNIFVVQPNNLGSIHQYGLKLTGVLKLGMLSINPSLALYQQETNSNHLAHNFGIENKKNIVFESGFSSIISFKNNFTLSAILQYSTSKENIQDNYYCDALYFISLDKTFKKNLKLGIVSALPFTKSFIYQGSDIKTEEFSSQYTGNLKLPTIPLMFRINYQFKVGKNRNLITRDKESVDMKPKQGF